jgi:hypothetical protein
VVDVEATDPELASRLVYPCAAVYLGFAHQSDW